MLSIFYKRKILILFLMIVPITIYSQEWSSRITIMERHLEDSELVQDGSRFKLFPDTDNSNFSLISFQGNTKNVNAGINMIIEKDLPQNEVSIQDFFMYSLGFKYVKDSFSLHLDIENFFSLSQTIISVKPSLFDNNLVYLEHDTPSIIKVSINYNF